jgi:hypothetical protein
MKLDTNLTKDLTKEKILPIDKIDKLADPFFKG